MADLKFAFSPADLLLKFDNCRKMMQSMMGEQTPSDRDWMEHRLQILQQDAVLKGIVESGIVTSSKSDYLQPRLDVDAVFPDDSQRRLLHLLFQHNKSKTELFNYVTIMTDFGADLNAEDAEGRTPVMTSLYCQKMPLDLFRALIEDRKTQLEKQDRQERTILMHAVQVGRSDYVRVLGDEIVKRNMFSIFVLRNQQNETAEDIARRLGNSKCEKILSKRRLKLLETINRQLTDSSLHRDRLFPWKKRRKTDAFMQVTYAHRALNRWETLAARNRLRDRSHSAIGMEQIELEEGEEEGSSVQVKPSRQFLDVGEDERKRSLSFTQRVACEAEELSTEEASPQSAQHKQVLPDLRKSINFAIDVAKGVFRRNK